MQRAVHKHAGSNGADNNIENIQLKSNRFGQQGGDSTEADEYNAEDFHFHAFMRHDQTRKPRTNAL